MARVIIVCILQATVADDLDKGVCENELGDCEMSGGIGYRADFSRWIVVWIGIFAKMRRAAGGYKV